MTPSKEARASALDRMPPMTKRFSDFESGDEVHITGRRGPFRFINARLNADGSVRYVTVYGPTGWHAQLHSFDPERVKA